MIIETDRNGSLYLYLGEMIEVVMDTNDYRDW